MLVDIYLATLSFAGPLAFRKLKVRGTITHKCSLFLFWRGYGAEVKASDRSSAREARSALSAPPHYKPGLITFNEPEPKTP